MTWMGDHVGAIGSILAVIIGTGTILRVLWKVAAGINDQFEDVKAIKKELHPNGGSSLRDAVDFAARSADEAAKRSSEASDEIRTHTHEDTDRFTKVTEQFETVNDSLAEIGNRIGAIEDRSHNIRSGDT